MRELSKDNEVFLISNFEDIKTDMEFFKGVTLVHVPIVRKISLFADVMALAKIFLFFRREQFDIVHSGTPKAGLLAMVTARVVGVPLRFHTFTGQVWATKTGFFRWLLKEIDTVIYHSASDVLVDSHSQRAFLIKEGIIEEEGSYVLAKGSICGVDSDRFKPDAERKIAIRDRLHIPVDAFVFSFLGRMTKDKGIEELLLAFDRIASEHANAYLLLIGPDDEKIIHKMKEQLLFKNGRILYQSFTRTPEIYMSAADVMCLPSHREGFGMVVLEAAAAGIPTIGSRITGVIDAIEDGETGLFHPQGDVGALYECMCICIVDRKRTRHLGRQARLRTLKDFSSRLLTEEFLKYYTIKLRQAHARGSTLPVKAEFAKPVKILFLTRVPMTAMRFIFPFAKRLRERGNIVEFAFGPGEGLEEVEQSGYPFTLLSMGNRSSSIENIRVLYQLKNVIIKGKYDVVHMYTPIMGLYGRIAAFRARTPVVIHSVIGSLLASGVPFFHRLFYFMSELITSHLVDLFITLNDADAQTLVKYRFASKENVVLLNYEYGVDLKKFDPDNFDRIHLEEVRKEHHFQEGVPVIGFVGRMIGAKGILDLFRAYQQIRAKGIRAKLIFLGDIFPSVKDRRSYALLKNRVKESGFEDDVIFFGWHEDIPFYLSLMDVVVLPSHYEGFPRIPVEAGAMKKPSICTATSGAEVAIEEGVTGFVVPIKDPRRLAEAIQKIITDPDLARRMGNAARRRVVELFGEDKIVEQQIQIYEEFFKKRKGITKYSV
jgi:glycosyltransferase involved in cell wall biosynthesis